jgi:hypothetical protein
MEQFDPVEYTFRNACVFACSCWTIVSDSSFLCSEDFDISGVLVCRRELCVANVSSLE